jgi:hypothetical protein
MGKQNVDTLKMSFDFESYDIFSSRLRAELKTLKELAKKYQSDGSFEKATICLITDTFEVLPNGDRFHNYILHNDLLEIRIAEARSKNEDNFPIAVRFKSAFLWSFSLEGAYNIVCMLLTNIFGDILNEKISRVDLCYHTDQFNFKQLDIDNFSGKFRSTEIFLTDRKLNGFTFGSSVSGIMARIYNKSLEVKQKNNKLWFYEIWGEADMDINNVWNIEFQVVRKKLYEFEINTFNDLISKINSLWDYLIQEWLVLKVPSHTRKENDEIHDLWLKLYGLFFAFNNTGYISRSKQAEYNAQALIPNIAGLISSYSAYSDGDNIENSFSTCQDKVNKYLAIRGKSFDEIVNKKKKLKEVNKHG